MIFWETKNQGEKSLEGLEHSSQGCVVSEGTHNLHGRHLSCCNLQPTTPPIVSHALTFPTARFRRDANNCMQLQRSVSWSDELTPRASVGGVESHNLPPLNVFSSSCSITTVEFSHQLVLESVHSKQPNQ